MCAPGQRAGDGLMCGFVGFWSADGVLDPRFGASEPWRGLIRHRGPDGERSVVDAGAAMHFTRLSILDLSERGMQPMRSRCGRYVMVFNGEIVNFQELARQYDLQLESQSDSEVLLELYARIGERAVSVIRGMYAFIVYDTVERTVVAYRDPFGIKPLYYAQQGTHLILASEIRPILRALGGSEVDEGRILRFLRRGEIDDGASTLYCEVRQVPPGHRLRWQDGRCSVAHYRDDDITPMDDADEPTQRAAYYDLLVRTVQEYLYADVPVGVSLSGGLDSSLLAHLVSRHQDAGQRRLMVTRGYQDYAGNETDAARLVAQRCGFDWHPVFLRPEEVPEMLRVCSAQQEHPITSISILAFHKLYLAARALGLKVLLEGHGGDELWAGYPYYRDPAWTVRSHDGSSFALNDEVVRHDGSFDEEGSSEETIGPSLASCSELTRRQLADLFGGKLQRSLRFVDRASMRAAVEVRVPFLDPAVALPALRMPDAWKIRHGQLRSFIRQLARPYLGDAIALRPKVPIQDPQRAWVQGPLKAYLHDLLLSRSLWIGQFVDLQRLRRLYEAFLSDPDQFDNLTFLVFPVFLEEWHRAMQDDPLSSSLTVGRP